MAAAQRGGSGALALYRRLLRAASLAFDADAAALSASHQRIRSAFDTNRDKAGEALTQALKLGEDVERELRENVLQAQLTEKGAYRMRITEHTRFLDNAKVPDTPTPPKPKPHRRRLSKPSST